MECVCVCVGGGVHSRTLCVLRYLFIYDFLNNVFICVDLFIWFVVCVCVCGPSVWTDVRV